MTAHAPRTAARPFSIRLLALGVTASVAGAAALATPALAQTAAGAAFSDISGSPNAPAISFLAGAGVVNGYGNGTFLPNNGISRAEFAALVVRLLGPKAEAAAAALANTTPPFADALSIPTWAWGYINYASGQGLITGFPDHTFQAGQPVTMVQAAAILIRAIGDTAAVPSGTWPSNYTLAAYNLDLNTAVTFVANLPALRADAAQLAYNAVMAAPTLQAGYVSGTPTGAPLYMGGAGFPQTAWTGTVSGVTGSTMSLSSASGTSILNGAPLAPTYYLFGASDAATLQGLQATIAENAQGQVDFIQAQAGTANRSGSLASASVATPAGYARLSDFLVSDSGGSALLLADGSLVPLLSTTSNGGTAFYLNAPTAGPAADAHALVSGVANLADGDPISVTVNASGQAVAVYAQSDTATAGVVSAVNAAAGTLTYTTGASDSTSTTVALQSWTDVTLNGTASSVGSLQKGDVVAVQVVGGGNGGDTNARLIAATRQTVSGTVTTLTSRTGASGTTTVIGITPTGGAATDITADSSFDSGGVTLQVGDAVMLVLDSQGQARLVESLAPEETVVLVQGVQTNTSAAGTVNQIVVNTAGQSATYNLATGTSLPPQPNSNGYLAVLTFLPGQTTVQTVGPLVQEATNYRLQVVSDSNGYLLLQQYDSAGHQVGNPLVVAGNAGAVVYQGTTYQPFGSLQAGAVVTLWGTAQGTYLGIRQ